MVIPLVAFIEERVGGGGAVRIPMCKLLTDFLRHFILSPNQCTLNIFKVVSSVVELNSKI